MSFWVFVSLDFHCHTVSHLEDFDWKLTKIHNWPKPRNDQTRCTVALFAAKSFSAGKAFGKGYELWETQKTVQRRQWRLCGGQRRTNKKNSFGAQLQELWWKPPFHQKEILFCKDGTESVYDGPTEGSFQTLSLLFALSRGRWAHEKQHTTRTRMTSRITAPQIRIVSHIFRFASSSSSSVETAKYKSAYQRRGKAG